MQCRSELLVLLIVVWCSLLEIVFNYVVNSAQLQATSAHIVRQGIIMRHYSVDRLYR